MAFGPGTSTGAKSGQAWSAWGLALGACLSVAACSASVGPWYGDAPPLVLTTADSAGVRDLRAAYRAELCPRLPSAGPACEQILLTLAGEGSAPPRTDLRPGAPQRYRVAFVPGLLAECLDGVVRPFSDAMEGLRWAGFDVHHLSVAGRGSSKKNADQLARELAALPRDPRRLIVFAYSKGLPDVLELILRYPEAASSIAAIVSIAGAANGSLLADRLNAVFRTWFSSLPVPHCRPGDGEEILDLRRDVRLEWWRRHRAAMVTPVFALVTAPRPDQLSPVLLESYRALARIEPRNDGQLLWHDQIVAGGSLLGYVNADHWGVAMPLSRAMPGLAFLFRDDVPRIALVEAAIAVVDGALASRSGAQP